MIVDLITRSAEQFGINSIITNSDKGIEIQLNSLTRAEDLPIMLISWDLETSLTFDKNGFLENPVTPIVALLMTKAKTSTKADFEQSAKEMAVLFVAFIQELYKSLIPYNKNSTTLPITNVKYTNIPVYGMGKHSGVLCKWTMKTGIEIDC